MLVLSRKEGERIQIGDDVAVTVVRITNNVVRLGIEAPPHIAIVRSELTSAENESRSCGAFGKTDANHSAPTTLAPP